MPPKTVPRSKNNKKIKRLPARVQDFPRPVGFVFLPLFDVPAHVHAVIGCVLAFLPPHVMPAFALAFDPVPIVLFTAVTVLGIPVFSFFTAHKGITGTGTFAAPAGTEGIFLLIGPTPFAVDVSAVSFGPEIPVLFIIQRTLDPFLGHGLTGSQTGDRCQ
jgi:hypothetical protein